MLQLLALVLLAAPAHAIRMNAEPPIAREMLYDSTPSFTLGKIGRPVWAASAKEQSYAAKMTVARRIGQRTDSWDVVGSYLFEGDEEAARFGRQVVRPLRKGYKGDLIVARHDNAVWAIPARRAGRTVRIGRMAVPQSSDDAVRGEIRAVKSSALAKARARLEAGDVGSAHRQLSRLFDAAK